MRDGWFWFQVDLACASAHWEAENHEYAKSESSAGTQAVAIGHELDKYRQQLNSRG